MRVFFGAAIQGLGQRGQRSEVYRAIIEGIKNQGHILVSEHVATGSMAETTRRLEESIGPLPPFGMEWTIYVREKMVEAVESDIGAAVFEVSTPSLGTGIEIAHAYSSPRMGLSPIPILALYEKDYWPNNLSSMIRGITEEAVPHFLIEEYSTKEQAQALASEFVKR